MIRRLFYCLITSSLAFISIAQADEDTFGKIIFEKGESTLTRNLKRMEVKKNLIVKQNDYLRTRQKSYVWIGFKDDQFFTLAGSTAIRLRKNPLNTDETEIRLNQGVLRTKINKTIKKKKKFRVKTPIATIGVRGTDFLVHYNPDEKNNPLTLFVFHGVVAVTSPKNPDADEVLVKKNQRLQVKKDGSFDEIEDITQGRSDLEMSRYPIIEKMPNVNLDTPSSGSGLPGDDDAKKESEGEGAGSENSSEDEDDQEAGSSQGISIWTILLILLGISVLAAALFFLKRFKGRGSFEGSMMRGVQNRDEYQSADVHVIRGNLTADQGPLVTEKVTHILGDVEDGAIIQASHPLLIKGSFQGGVLTSSANVAVVGGINGHQKGLLEINGNLETAYINEASIYVQGKVIVENSIRNANVIATDSIIVQEKSIMGGVIASNQGIECGQLGSDFCETKVILGEPAASVWKDTLQKDSSLEDAETEKNEDAILRVREEIVSASLSMCGANLEQKSSMKGPLESHYDKANLKVSLRGYRLDEV